MVKRLYIANALTLHKNLVERFVKIITTRTVHNVFFAYHERTARLRLLLASLFMVCKAREMRACCKKVIPLDLVSSGGQSVCVHRVYKWSGLLLD